MLLEHGGYALFVAGGRLVHLYNDLAVDRFEVASNIEVPIGDVTLRYESVPAGPIRFQEGKGPVGFSCGDAAFDTVAPGRYAIPFRFTGTIHRVTDDAEFQALMSQQ